MYLSYFLRIWSCHCITFSAHEYLEIYDQETMLNTQREMHKDAPNLLIYIMLGMLKDIINGYGYLFSKYLAKSLAYIFVKMCV